MGWDGKRELCSTRVLCPCLLSLSAVARAPHSCCASLLFPAAVFAACLSCVSLRALCSHWDPGKRGKSRNPSSVPTGQALPAGTLRCAGLKVS